MMDYINGSFEIVGGLLQILNIRQLMKDKQIKGVSWPVTGFFTSWGIWNLLYYPHLGQWFSALGGLLLVITNAIWLSLVWRYSKGGVSNGNDTNPQELVRTNRPWVSSHHHVTWLGG